MADFQYNVARGRVVELARRVLNNDPATAGFTVVAINTTATDATLQDLDTLAAIIADGNTAEVTNSGYARHDISDTVGGLAIQVDDTNNWTDVDFGDITFTNIAAGDAWTDLVVCYNPDITADVDANILPLCQFDYPATPDGSSLVVTLDAEGFFRSAD
jgi:hypothetical protein